MCDGKAHVVILNQYLLMRYSLSCSFGLNLFDILYAHHGQIVALFCIAHELVDGIGHQGDELVGLLLLLGESLDCHIVNAIHLELFIFDIHRLGQSVGEEEMVVPV